MYKYALILCAVCSVSFAAEKETLFKTTNMRVSLWKQEFTQTWYDLEQAEKGPKFVSFFKPFVPNAVKEEEIRRTTFDSKFSAKGGNLRMNLQSYAILNREDNDLLGFINFLHPNKHGYVEIDWGLKEEVRDKGLGKEVLAGLKGVIEQNANKEMTTFTPEGGWPAFDGKVTSLSKPGCYPHNVQELLRESKFIFQGIEMRINMANSRSLRVCFSQDFQPFQCQVEWLKIPPASNYVNASVHMAYPADARQLMEETDRQMLRCADSKEAYKRDLAKKHFMNKYLGVEEGTLFVMTPELYKQLHPIIKPEE